MQLTIRTAHVALALATSFAISACGDNVDESSPARVPQVVASTGSQQITVGSTSPTITAQVTDQFGFTIAGTPVTFTTSGGTLSSTSGTSDANGNVSTTLSVGNLTTVDTVRATIAGNTTPALFVITAAPGAASTITVVSGNAQSAAAGTALPNPLVAQVKDAFGNTISGLAVDWAGPGALGIAQTTTDSAGRASNTLILQSTKGNSAITATVHNAPATVATFTETGT